MANRKRSSRRQQPQPQHKYNLKKSQHDKRQRLKRHNPKRKKTTEAKVPLAGAIHKVVLMMRVVLDKRMAFRLSIIIAGILLNRRMIAELLWRGLHQRACCKIGIGLEMCVQKGPTWVA